MSNQENPNTVFKKPSDVPVFKKENVMVEQEEEAKLKEKYPNIKTGGGSALLHKRLQRGQKFFDSGDYNMAKAKMKTVKKPVEKTMLQESTGETIPTPENLPPRKPSLIQSKLASGALS
ncbi:hypothetical protein ScPMuIL_018688 [Solemya velum]